MKRLIILSFFISLLGFSQENSPQIQLEIIAENLVAPVAMACPNDVSGRIFVAEQKGLIRIIDNKKLVETPFLDISKKVIKLFGIYDERGLLGLVFHPQFKENGRFFIYYSSNLKQKGNNHIAILCEYKVDPANPNKALPEDKVILQINEPEWNHNGGQLMFGQDGYLYLGLGDGGGAGDRHGADGNAQNKSTLLGKILRLDIDSKSPYGIPTDNPFVGQTSRAEIYAYGLRNPWRFSQDKVTGRIFCGDVGQNQYEEVNIIEKGKNYGWRIMEGLHCYNPGRDCNTSGLTLPIAEYDHGEGISVTGGYVYRGKLMPAYEGKYIFADWKGILFSLTEQPDNSWKREKLKTDFKNFKGLNINSFGEDQNGELYILTQNSNGPFQSSGKLLKLSINR